MEQNQQDKIWDFYENIKKENFKNNNTRLKKIYKYIKKDKGGGSREKKNNEKVKILNIGIGDGTFEEICLYYNLNIYSLDPNKKAIERLKSKYKSHSKKFAVGYSQDIPFKDNLFDYVVVSEVLEHLPKKILLDSLKEIKRVLKKEGKIIGTVPSQERLENSKVVCPNCGLVYHMKGHENSFDKKSMTNLLEKWFDVEKCTSINMSNWTSLNLKGKITVCIIKVIRVFGIHSHDENIFFVGKVRK